MRKQLLSFSLQKPHPGTLLNHLKIGVLLTSASSIISSIILRKKSLLQPSNQMISPTCPHWSNTLSRTSFLLLFSHLIPNFLKIRIKSYILGSSPVCHSSSFSVALLDHWWHLTTTAMLVLKMYLVMNPSCLASQIVRLSKTKNIVVDSCLFGVSLPVLCFSTYPKGICTLTKTHCACLGSHWSPPSLLTHNFLDWDTFFFFWLSFAMPCSPGSPTCHPQSPFLGQNLILRWIQWHRAVYYSLFFHSLTIHHL